MTAEPGSPRPDSGASAAPNANCEKPIRAEPAPATDGSWSASPIARTFPWMRPQLPRMPERQISSGISPRSPYRDAHQANRAGEHKDQAKGDQPVRRVVVQQVRVSLVAGDKGNRVDREEDCEQLRGCSIPVLHHERGAGDVHEDHADQRGHRHEAPHECAVPEQRCERRPRVATSVSNVVGRRGSVSGNQRSAPASKKAPAAATAMKVASHEARSRT